MNFLLMDFGASRIKSALFDTDSGRLCGITDQPAVRPLIQDHGKFEVPPESLRNRFASIADGYMKQCRIDGICFCTEMHGFALMDDRGRCLSNYISWRDERENSAKEKVFPSFAAAFSADDYLARTGMFITSSPIPSLLHLLKNISRDTVKVVGMPELFAGIDGPPANIAHVSSIAGLGMWNMDADRPDADILEYIRRHSGCRVSFNQVVSDLQPSGSFRKIPVFCGLGDLQCAVIGAGNDENSISVNMGTGSQVSWIGQRKREFERRPLVNGQMMQTITHIPSGRALNNFIGFLTELAPGRDFWKELAELHASDIADAKIDFDLNIFHGAWHYRGGGCITGIQENELTVKHFLASLLKSYLGQFWQVIDLFAPPPDIKIILSGGIPGRLPAISEYLKAKTGMSVCHSREQEETLNGLKKLVGRFCL